MRCSRVSSPCGSHNHGPLGCHWRLSGWSSRCVYVSPINTRHAIMAVCGLVIFVVSPFFVEQLYSNRTLPHCFTRRDVLNQGAVRMFAQHPLLGIGLNCFTQQIENYVSSSEVVRFIQPAHNVALRCLGGTAGSRAGTWTVHSCITPRTKSVK